MCDWGVDDPWKWARPVANSWRTGEGGSVLDKRSSLTQKVGQDMHDSWDNLIYTIDHNVGLSSYSGPGG